MKSLVKNITYFGLCSLVIFFNITFLNPKPQTLNPKP